MSAVVAIGVVALLGRGPGAVVLAGVVPMIVVVAIGGFVSRSMGDVVHVVVGGREWADLLWSEYSSPWHKVRVSLSVGSGRIVSSLFLVPWLRIPQVMLDISWEFIQICGISEASARFLSRL